MTNPTHGAGPRLQRKRGIHAQAQNLCIRVAKLLQPTVEGGSLARSATGKGEREGMQHDPFIPILLEGYLFAIVASEFEVGRLGSGFKHVCILRAIWKTL